MPLNRENITPIFLHPAKREALFRLGQNLFNDEKFFEAHEAWEQLWHLECGRDRDFIQGLIQIAGHFVHLEKLNHSGAERLAQAAHEKLRFPPTQTLYRRQDLEPVMSAVSYNERLLRETPDAPRDRFLFPKLFEF